MAPKRLQPQPKSAWRVTIEGMPNLYFTTSSPIEETFQKSTYQDGQLLRNLPMVGNGEYADITISKPHDPIQDQEFFDYKANTYDPIVGMTLTVAPLIQGRNAATVRPYTVLGALLITWRVAEVDSTSSDPSMLELVLAPFDTQLSSVTNNTLSFQ